MPSTTVAALQDLRNDLICKFSTGAAIIADYSAAPITTLFAVDGTLNTLPTGYSSCGLTDVAGLVQKRAMTVAQVMAWQSTQSQRSDVTSDVLTVQVKFLEAIKPPVVALQTGTTLAAAPALGSAVAIDRSDDSVQPYRRLLLLGNDSKLNIIVGRYFPRVSVTAVGDETWARANETVVDITFEVYPDAAYGTSARRFLGGTGWGPLGATPWTATTAYVLGAYVTNSGAVLKCTTAGTSGSTAPTNPAVGSTVTDGTVVWTRQS